MKREAKQIVIVRRDILESSQDEIDNMSQDKRSQYFEQLGKVGKMPRGKLAAQVSHASMAPILRIMRGNVPYAEYDAPEGNYELSLSIEEDTPLKAWIEGSFAKIILAVKSEEKLLSLYKQISEAGFVCDLIQDEGRTAFKEPTYTCLGIEPVWAKPNFEDQDSIERFTKRLNLLK